MSFYKKSSQSETSSSENGSSSGKSSGGSFLIAAAIFLAGITIAAAVLIKDNVKLPLKEEQKEEVLGTGNETGNNQPSTDRISIEAGDAPSLGSADAPVTIIEFSDFTCPYCAAANGYRQDVISALQQRNLSWQPALVGIKEKYIDTGLVRLVFKVIPGHGQEALDAGEVAYCAGDQGKFWEMHDVLFEKQDLWYTGDATASAKLWKDYAADLKLDMTEFNECVTNDTHSAAVMQNYKDSQDAFTALQQAGLAAEGQQGLGTPSYFVNGRLVAGAQSFAEFEKIIEEELNK